MILNPNTIMVTTMFANKIDQNGETIEETNKSILLKRIRWGLGSVLGMVLLLITALPAAVIAQPGLPSEPSQAPLGGLGYLAAAGGLYAVKKLKNSSSGRD